MSNIFVSLQALIMFAFGLAGLGLSLFCLIDAVRYRPDAFTAAGKRTKNFWLLVLGVAVALSIISVGPPIGGLYSAFSLPWIVAAIGAGVYAADVRPALRKVMGRGSSGDGPGRW